MTLSEILEENSVKAISTKTMISEENIELLIAENFASLAKAKAMGFISIIERDYQADLSALKQSALAYYDTHKNLEDSVNIALPRVEEKKGRSKLFPLVMLGLLAYASWFFFTQYDKQTLGTVLPFTEDDNTTSIENKEIQEDTSAISIKGALETINQDASGAQTGIVVANIEPKETSQVPVQKEMEKEVKHTGPIHALVRNRKIVILPEKKLWFGLIDMQTGERKHFSISKQYQIDVTKKRWLLATSPAGFALINHNKTQEYNDARAHYFQVSYAGIEPLSKDEYIAKGGYKKW